MRAYIISQFFHRPGRAIGVIGGVALGAALFVALTSLGAGLRQASQAPLAGVAADFLTDGLLTAPGKQEICPNLFCYQKHCHCTDKIYKSKAIP